jgi:hypothetical protein
MANSLLKTTDKTIKTARKRVKKAAVTKAAKTAVNKMSTRTKAVAAFAIGAPIAAGAVVLRRRSGGGSSGEQPA